MNKSFLHTYKKELLDLYKKSKIELAPGNYSDLFTFQAKNLTKLVKFFKSSDNNLLIIPSPKTEAEFIHPHKPYVKGGGFFVFDKELSRTLYFEKQKALDFLIKQETDGISISDIVVSTEQENLMLQGEHIAFQIGGKQGSIKLHYENFKGKLADFHFENSILKKEKQLKLTQSSN